MNGDELSNLICDIRTYIYKLKCEANFLSDESLKKLIISDAQHQLEKIQETVSALRPALESLRKEITKRKDVIASLERNLSSVQEEVDEED